MTTGEPSLKRLGALLKRVKAKHPAPEEVAPTEAPGTEAVLGADPVLAELLMSMLLWDATTGQARHALRRLREQLVDLNELRVCVAQEIADILGEKYPFALERGNRLRSLLSDIYQREHRVQLSHLESLSKREARAYLESLEGVPHFAAARTFALALGGHAVPVDNRLRELLAQEDMVKGDATCAALSGWLERNIGADDSRASLLALQAWSDEAGHPPKREPAPEESPGRATVKTDSKPKSKAGPKPGVKKSKATGKAASPVGADKGAKASKAAKPAPTGKQSGKDTKA